MRPLVMALLVTLAGCGSSKPHIDYPECEAAPPPRQQSYLDCVGFPGIAGACVVNGTIPCNACRGVLNAPCNVASGSILVHCVDDPAEGHPIDDRTVAACQACCD